VSFLLDTNVLSEHMRRPSGLVHRFVQHSGRLYTSSVSLSELYVWAFGRPDPAPTLSAIETLLTYEVSVIPFDADCAEEFGRLRVDLRQKGIGVGNIDLLIAATARVFDLTLVTHNMDHFDKVPNLRLEDWLSR
jgi:tRNA(fMet)-specific endonuclease VapC